MFITGTSLVKLDIVVILLNSFIYCLPFWRASLILSCLLSTLSSKCLPLVLTILSIVHSSRLPAFPLNPILLGYWSLKALHAKHFSRVQLFATLLTIACQTPLSMGFSRQEHWHELPYPPPGDLPNPGIGLVSYISFSGRWVLYH